MRWFIYIPCRSEGQVLQGHLVYLGFIEQRALIPLTFIVALFPHWNSFAGIAPTVFLVSEPQMTTENYIGSMLNLTWTPFEIVDAWLESTNCSITSRSQPRMGLSNLQWKATKDWHSGAYAKQIRGARNGMILHKFPNWKKWFLSRSVHARFTVIVGLMALCQ